MSSGQSVKTVYQSVVDDVINGVREAFLDDGTDDHVLQELKQLWEAKLAHSKALEIPAAQASASSLPVSQFQQKAQTNFPGYSRIATHQQQPQTMQTVPQMQNFTVLPQSATNQNMQHMKQPQALNLQTFPGGQQLVFDPITRTLTAVHQPTTSHQQLTNVQSLGVSNGQPIYHVMQATPQQNIALSYKPVITKPQVDGSFDLKQEKVHQFDGLGDSSSDEDDEAEANEEEEEDLNDDNEEANGEEEDPLNSEDDISNTDPTEVFDADNVVVCQFDKINRCKTKWKFHLKDGIMNLNGKDHVFHIANGDAEW